MTKIATTILLTTVVGGALISLSAQASTVSLDDIDPSGSITVNGTATGTAAAGTSSITGLPTTATQLANAQTHAAGYNGATQFTAKYDVTLNAQNMFVSGTVTFVTNSYTANGNTVTSDFTTQPITITGATVNPDGSVASIDFSSTNWYPANGTGASGLTNNGLSGTINLKTGASSYTSSYISKRTGAIYTYVVTTTPLPSTWLMLISGFVGLGSLLIAGRKRIKTAR